MDEILTVTIPLERYEQLLETETRTEILTERLIKNNYTRTEEVLRIIGTPKAIRKADELHKEEEKERAEYEKKWKE